MIITKKKHEERLRACMNASYDKGHSEGYNKAYEFAYEVATENFEKQLKSYNNVSLEIKSKYLKEIDDFKEALDIKETSLKLAMERVDELENKLIDAQEYGEAMHSVADEIDIELNECREKVKILNTFLKIHYDEEVARYEAIAKRTKKFRIRKKAESRIIQLKMDRLAFE